MPTIHTVAREVAKHLGDWRYREGGEHYAKIQHNDGATASLYAPRWPPSRTDRIEVRGVYPPTPEGHIANAWTWGVADEPRITVSASRGAAAVARDFRRRFEPAFLAVWREVDRKHIASLVGADVLDRQLEALIAAARDSRRHWAKERRALFYGAGEDAWHGEAYVGSLGVDLKLNGLRHNVALAVIELVTKADP